MHLAKITADKQKLSAKNVTTSNDAIVNGLILSKLHHFNTHDISNNINKCKTAFHPEIIDWTYL